MTATAGLLLCCCSDEPCGTCSLSSFLFEWSGTLTLGAVCNYEICLGCLGMVGIGGYEGSMVVGPVSLVLTPHYGEECTYRGTQSFEGTTTLCAYDPEECEEGNPATVTTKIDVEIELRFESPTVGWVIEMLFKRYVDFGGGFTNAGLVSCDFGGSAIMGRIKFCPDIGPQTGDCPYEGDYVDGCGTSDCTPPFDSGPGSSVLASCEGTMKIDEWTIGTVTIS